MEEKFKMWKLTDDIRRTSSDGKSSHCIWQDELKTTAVLKKKIVIENLNIIYIIGILKMCRENFQLYAVPLHSDL